MTVGGEANRPIGITLYLESHGAYNYGFYSRPYVYADTSGGSVTAGDFIAAGLYYEEGFIPAASSFHASFMTEGVGDLMANDYFLYHSGTNAIFDVKSDGVMEYYNPSFTRYTPGAANYERLVQQWSGNVAQYGTQYGGTGQARSLALLTGNSARLTIDPSGNIGIGSTSPEAKLDVSGFIRADGLMSISGDYPDLAFNGFYTDSWRYDTNGYSHLIEADTVDGGLYFYTAPSGTAGNAITYTPRMIITPAGSVGIGTDLPNATLDINSDTFILRTAKTPASANSTCTTGSIAWDSGFVYVCTATNTWKRSALTTW